MRIISACKGTQRGMNLPQPGTTKTKGRKEQTSALKTSWEAARSVPLFPQLVSHTWVCMVRALTGTLILFCWQVIEGLDYILVSKTPFSRHRSAAQLACIFPPVIQPPYPLLGGIFCYFSC